MPAPTHWCAQCDYPAAPDATKCSECGYASFKSQPRSDRWRKRAKQTAEAAGWTLAMLLVAWVGLRLTLKGCLLGQIHHVHAAGDPANAEDLERWLKYPLGPNAAEHWHNAAIARVHEGPATDGMPLSDWVPSFNQSPERGAAIYEIPKLGEQYPAEIMTRVRDYLALNQAALDEAERAVLAQNCRWPSDWRQGLATPCPQVGIAADLQRLLGEQQRLATFDRNGARRLAALEASLALAVNMADAPSARGIVFADNLVSQAQSQWMDSQACHPPDDAELAALRVQLAQAQAKHLRIAPQGITGMRALWLGSPLNTKVLSPTNAPTPDPGVIMTRIFLALGTGDLDRMLLSHWFGQSADILKGPVNTWVPQADHLKRAWQRSLRPWQIVTANEGGAAMDLILSHAHIQAHLTCGDTALAVAQYQRHHGHLPASLAELVPEYLPAIPCDPLNPGNPIGYRVDNDRFHVMSAGSAGTIAQDRAACFTCLRPDASRREVKKKPLASPSTPHPE